MRILFDMDAKDYDPQGRRFVRPSARGIIIQENTLATAYVSGMDYYKFPGGGIEPKEDPQEALIREVREEAGLIVKPQTINEYGTVHRIEFHSEHGNIFDQMNYYYFCEAEEERLPLTLTPDELSAGFAFRFAAITEAIEANRRAMERTRSLAMGCDKHYATSKQIERELRVMELLLQEGFFSA